MERAVAPIAGAHDHADVADHRATLIVVVEPRVSADPLQMRQERVVRLWDGAGFAESDDLRHDNEPLFEQGLVELDRGRLLLALREVQLDRREEKNNDGSKCPRHCADHDYFFAKQWADYRYHTRTTVLMIEDHPCRPGWSRAA